MRAELPAWKQAALARFEAWLNEAPDAEPVFAEESPIDLYTLAEELTALKQEMRTLGRNTARLADSGEAVSKTLREELPTLLKKQAAGAVAAPDRQALLAARRAAERPFLIELGDLSAALNELVARRVEMAWPFYVPAAVRKRLLSAQAKPLEVLTSRVAALLSRHAVKPLAVVGEPFEAARMNAAGVSSTGAVAAGCISAVVRQGFVCGDDVLRMAEVVVEEKIS